MNLDPTVGAVELAVLSRLNHVCQRRQSRTAGAEPPPRLIAITGGSGAGKNWLADRLQQSFGNESARVSLDDFYRDLSFLAPAAREKINFDDPSAIDWPGMKHVLNDCRAGRPTRLPRYDFKTHTRISTGDWGQPKSLIFVDGLWLLHSASLRRLFDLKIFIDCSAALRLERRVARDVLERGRDEQAVRRQFADVVAPMHDRHVAPHVQWADIILEQPFREKDIHQLADQVWTLLAAPLRKKDWLRSAFQTELWASLKPQSTP